MLDGVRDDLLSVSPLAPWKASNFRVEKIDGHAVLAWEPGDPDQDYSAEEAERDPKAILAAFVRLALVRESKAADAVLRFATAYGPLWLCSHEVFGGHHAYFVSAAQPPAFLACPPSGREPIDAWRKLAQRAAAMLRIASALHLGRLPDAALWGSVSMDDGVWVRLTAVSGARTIDEEWQHLCLRVNQWLLSTQAVFSLRSVPRGQPALILGGETAASSIATALAFTVLNRQLRLCDICGGPFDRQRAPKFGSPARCIACSKAHTRTMSSQRKRRSRERTSGIAVAVEG